MSVSGTSTVDGFRPKGMEVRLTDIPNDWDDLKLKLELQGPLAEFCERFSPGSEFNYDVLVILDKSSGDLKWDVWDAVSTPNTARLVIPDFELGKQLVLIKSLKLANVTLGVTVVNPQDTDNAKYEELRGKEYNFPWNLTTLRNGDLGRIILIECGNFNDKGGFDIAHTWAPPPAVFDTLCWFGDLWPKKFQACISASGPVGKSTEWSGEWMEIALPNINGLVFVPGSNGTLELFFVIDKPPRFYRRSPKSPQQRLPEKNLPAEAIAPDGSINTSLVRERGYRVPYPDLGPASSNSPEVIGAPWSIQYSRVYHFKIQDMQKSFNKESIMKEITNEKKDKVFVFDHATIASHDSRENFTKEIKEATGIIDSYVPECRLALYKVLYNCNVPPSNMNSIDKALEALAKDFKNKPTPQDIAFLHTLLKTSAEKMGTSQLRALKRLYEGTKDNISRDTVIVDPSQAVKDCSKDETLKDRYTKKDADIPKQVFYLLIFPSHAEIQGPENAPENSVTQEFHDEVHRFLGVRFVENNGERLRTESGIDADSIIEQRVYNILKAPLNLSGKQYEFLGYSNSSLKNRNQVWLFSRENNGKVTSAEAIRDWIGDWKQSKNLARNPSKWGARIGQAFSASTPVFSLLPEEWEVREDINNAPQSGPALPYTDGCGFISKGLCGRINEALGLKGVKV
jgi:RNA dependent RNA polymerase